jgi:LPS sulfotransferase NodH
MAESQARHRSTEIPHTYVVCATPRTGSTLLCQLLESCDAMGRPREVFNIKSTVRRFASRNGLLDAQSNIEIGSYLRCLFQAGTTPNGVFGAKVLFTQLAPFLEFETVRQFLRTSHFIYLTRTDIVAQAVSRHVARETGNWGVRSSDSLDERAQQNGNVLSYSQSKIQDLLDDIGRQNRGWLEFFAVNEIDFLSVTYEQIVSDANAVCQEICRHCGVRVDHEFSIERPGIRSQGSDEKAEFRRRHADSSYLKLDGAAGHAAKRADRRLGVRFFEEATTFGADAGSGVSGRGGRLRTSTAPWLTPKSK